MKLKSEKKDYRIRQVNKIFGEIESKFNSIQIDTRYNGTSKKIKLTKIKIVFLYFKTQISLPAGFIETSFGFCSTYRFKSFLNISFHQFSSCCNQVGVSKSYYIQKQSFLIKINLCKFRIMYNDAFNIADYVS